MRTASLHSALRRLAPRLLMAAATLVSLPAIAPAQTIDSLLSIALANHPTIAASAVTGERARANARASLALEPPRVGFEISELPPVDPNPLTRGEMMLMVEQEFDLGDGRQRMARAMELEADVAAESAGAVGLDLRERIERHYIALWMLDRRGELAARDSALARVMLQAAEVSYAAGRTPQSELYAISIEIEKARQERIEIDAERDETLATLNAILRRHRSTPVVVDSTLRLPELPSFDSLAALVDRHPELRAMEAMARMQVAEAEAEEGMLAPMLMLRGGVSYMPEGHPLREANVGEHGVTSHDPMGNVGLTAGAMISIPIAPWSRTGPEERAEASRLQSRESLLRRDAMRYDMLLMLREEYARARTARVRLDYAAVQIPLLEKQLEARRAEYSSGKGSLASVIDGLRMLSMARMDAAMRRMEYAMSLSMLGKMTGARLVEV